VYARKLGLPVPMSVSVRLGELSGDAICAPFADNPSSRLCAEPVDDHNASGSRSNFIDAPRSIDGQTDYSDHADVSGSGRNDRWGCSDRLCVDTA
jgi:hypothetical protein